MKFLQHFKFLVNYKTWKILKLSIVAIAVFLFSIPAMAASAVEYALILALVAAGIISGAGQIGDPTNSINPINISFPAFTYSDGVNNNATNPCTFPTSVNQGQNLGGCSSTEPVQVPLTFFVSAIPTSNMVWSTDAPSGSASLVVNSDDSRFATFTALQAGTYHVIAKVNPNQLGNSLFTFTFTETAVQSVTAIPGTDQAVNINNVVSLDGSGSTSPANTPLSYQWSFVSVPSGSQAVLNNASSVTSTFTPDKPGNYVVQLTVSSLINNIPVTNSANLNISTSVVAPVADAGSAQTVHPVSQVVLNSSQSFDPNGLPLTYHWTLQTPAGSNASLSNANSANPSFIVDVLGSYTASLVVNDGYLDSSPASVVIDTFNSAPIANAGSSGSTTVGTLVSLNGSGSSDADHDSLSYSWSLISKPAGSTALISNANQAIASFVPDLPGTYVAGLIVNDGFVSSSQATVQILTISNVTSIIQSIQALESTISGFPSSVFKNKNMQNTLINKLNSVISDINAGKYSDAASQLQNDISGKMNGCVASGAPSNSDWILNCPAQIQIYNLLQPIIANVKNLH